MSEVEDGYDSDESWKPHDEDEDNGDSEISWDSDEEDNAAGVTSDNNSAFIGRGGYKEVRMAEYTNNANNDGFKYLDLQRLGASDNFADYVIISYDKKYDANRLLAEIELQEEFVPHLAPITFAVEISLDGSKYKTVYGFDDIKTELKKLYTFDANHRVGVAYRTYIEPVYSSSGSIDSEYKRLLDLQASLTAIRLELISQFPNHDHVLYAATELNLQSINELVSRFDEYYKVRRERDSIQNISFRVLMQRTDYDRNGRSIPVSFFLNYDTLNALLNALLDKGCVLDDLKIDNLCILNGHLGALDYDVKYVKKREYYKVEGPRRTTGKLFMTLMVCLVSNHLSDDTVIDIFNKMGIITQGAPNMLALDGICLVPEFQERILHYLVPEDVRRVIHQNKPDVRHKLLADFIADNYIIPLLTDPNPAPVKKTKGGKSTRKRKRKRKEKKTRRKRSLHNHNLAR